jgi:translation initiation factor 2 gamma subunit (eIF-2gamma)
VGTKELLKVERINLEESLLLHVGNAVNIGKVVSIKGNVVKLSLTDLFAHSLVLESQ